MGLQVSPKRVSTYSVGKNVKYEKYLEYYIFTFHIGKWKMEIFD